MCVCVYLGEERGSERKREGEEGREREDKRGEVVEERGRKRECNSRIVIIGIPSVANGQTCNCTKKPVVENQTVSEI